MEDKSRKCFLCGSKDMKLLVVVSAQPAGEIYCGNSEDAYHREIHQCKTCGVFNNLFDYDYKSYYKGQYNQEVYSDKITEKYHEIMRLPEEKSDNKLRVQRVLKHMESRRAALHLDLLDVGSGLCVFAGEIGKHKVNCYCVDPDSRSVEHAMTCVGVKGAYTGNFEDVKIDRKFDLITFNKVLEHVEDPLTMLRRALPLLKEDGEIYIELPEGEMIKKAGCIVEREEFFIGHYTIFNDQSMRHLVKNAGMRIADSGSLIEPSGKYTIYAFVAKGAC